MIRLWLRRSMHPVVWSILAVVAFVIFWRVVLRGVLWIAFRVAWWIAGRHERPDVACPVCGYDVRETLHGCPECGTKLRWGMLP